MSKEAISRGVLGGGIEEQAREGEVMVSLSRCGKERVHFT